MDKICLKAMAKINLGLDVVRKREDGYHEVRMIMQTVDLWDRLTFTKICEDAIRITANKKEIPTDERNLIYKAAALLKKKYNIKEGVSVVLEKNIPVAAGMAGGSTDGAAALVAMNRLFNLSISMEELMELGVSLGADVPYCLMGGTALSEGIGEKLTTLPAAPECVLLIAKPDTFVSTKFVYENLRLDLLKTHPDIDGMRAAVEQGDLDGVIKRLSNVLETVTIKEYPVIEEIKTKMITLGAKGALMSGSGPTVFGIFEDKKAAEKAYAGLKESGLAKDIFVTTFTGNTCVEE